MCGIAGVLAGRDDSRTGAAVVRMTSALAHRGPDGDGFWSLAAGGEQHRTSEDLRTSPCAIALGHRRLSIVDLAGGAQPMSSTDGRVQITFNGEIYNYPELRWELEQKGYRFRTRSDTEALVHGWQEWGTDLFGRLNGIFAIALVSIPDRSVVLARDPVGVKPLYTGTHRGLTWWASETGAAVEAGLVGREFSADAVRLFLTFRFVPSPVAIFRNTWKVPPGHFVRLRYDDAGVAPKFERYRWNVVSSAQPQSQGDWSAALAETLRTAVRRQMMSDVPVASLLSGGVDSAVVSTLMIDESGSAPQGFGIGVTDSGILDESLAGAAVAAELGMPFRAVRVSSEDFNQAWSSSMHMLSEPIANPGLALVGKLCELVRETHKVVLTGQGADEPLGGYPRHVSARLWSIGRRAPGLFGFATQRLASRDSANRLARVLRAEDELDRILEILTVVPAETVDTITRSDGAPTRELARSVIARWLGDGDRRDVVNTLLRVDARLSLADDLLAVADQFSMRSSVELRVPFLDLELLELVERMPSKFKISSFGARKWLYRRVARRLLPSETSRRLCGVRARFGRKYGFSVPDGRVFGDPHEWLGGIDSKQDHSPLTPLLDSSRILASEIARSSRQRSAIHSLGIWTLGIHPSIAA